MAVSTRAGRAWSTMVVMLWLCWSRERARAWVAVCKECRARGGGGGGLRKVRKDREQKGGKE